MLSSNCMPLQSRRLHFPGLKSLEVTDALWRTSIPGWLSDFIISVMDFPQAESEAGPGERGGGEITIPWERTRERRDRGARSLASCIFTYCKYEIWVISRNIVVHRLNEKI